VLEVQVDPSEFLISRNLDYSAKCEFGCYGPGPDSCKESPPLVFFSGVPSDHRTTPTLRCMSTTSVPRSTLSHIADVLTVSLVAIVALGLLLVWSPQRDGYAPVPQGEHERGQPKGLPPSASDGAEHGEIVMAKPLFSRDDVIPASLRSGLTERSLESAV
jgi:hypothetical protein